MANYSATISSLWDTYNTLAAQPASEWGEGGHSAKMLSLREIREEIEALESRQASEAGGSRVFKPLVDRDYA